MPRAGMAVGHGPLVPAAREVAPRTFALPAGQEPAARSWWVHGERRPRAARAASSVAVVRDGPEGVETLLRYRSGATPLGTVAFPGGSLDTGDAGQSTWFGPSPAAWARVLGMGDHRLGRSHLLGAVRELFEESGVLLAGRDEFSVVQNPGGGEWGEARLALAGQDVDLPELLARRGLGVRTDLLRAVGRWHSPHFAHRRFDTQYLAAAVPQGQSTSLLAGTGVWSEWLPVRRVLEEREGPWLGDLIGQPDTVGRSFGALTVPAVELLLERMAAARSTVEFLMGLTVRGQVSAFTPVLTGTPETGFGLTVDLPGRP